MSTESGSEGTEGSTGTERPRLKLKSGLELYCINPLEAAFLDGESEDYFQEGISLAPGATVLDVGANIGMFTAKVFERLKGDVKIYAFEPVPPIFEVLELNCREVLGGAGITALPYGLSSTEAEVEFSFFPLMTGWSSADRGFTAEDLSSERQRLTDTVVEMIKQGRIYEHLQMMPKFLLRPMIEQEVGRLLTREPHRAWIRPLGDFLRDEELSRIDLLKIDVEGLELEVLRGLGEEHWPLVQQVVVEVDSFATRAQATRELLESKTFRVTLRQDDSQRAGNFGMLYAVR